VSKFEVGAKVVVTGGNYPLTTEGSIGVVFVLEDSKLITFKNCTYVDFGTKGVWQIADKFLDELYEIIDDSSYEAWCDQFDDEPPVEPEHVQEPDKHAQRKGQPIFSGCLMYFPDALLAIGECSRIANEQHNAGEPMHWSREKSADHHDALLRHLIDVGTLDDDKILHSTKVAWRALAALQLELENSKA
jgi:hypothetical protein